MTTHHVSPRDPHVTKCDLAVVDLMGDTHSLSANWREVTCPACLSRRAALSRVVFGRPDPRTGSREIKVDGKRVGEAMRIQSEMSSKETYWFVEVEGWSKHQTMNTLDEVRAALI